MIVRSPRPVSNFYLLDKRISEDRRLSWAARGLLIYVLGKPDNWRVSVTALVNEVAGTEKPTGRDATYALLDELIKAGYVRREPERGNDGKMAGINYVVFESPSPLPDQPETANPPLPPQPHTEKPHTAEPYTAKPTLTSTDIGTSIENVASTENNKRAQRARVSSARPSTGVPCPPEVNPQTFSDWLAVRKAKRAGPVTATVLSGIRAEAMKAGISLQDAIAHCCLAGWQGFKAEWYKSRPAKAEKFDPVAYVNRNRISTQRRDREHERDTIDITPERMA
jgi:hypothetical protein